jgi:Ca2+-binding RTX toxin-like protein
MTADLLDGGAGSDILEAADGSDTYKFAHGYGSDIVRETVTNVNLAENDRLVFGADVLPSDVSFARDGDDLLVTMAGTGDSLRIEGQFNFVSWFSWNDIERFEFADGTTWTDVQVAARILGGTAGNDHLVGTFRSDTLDGQGGNDLLVRTRSARLLAMSTLQLTMNCVSARTLRYRISRLPATATILRSRSTAHPIAFA